MLNCCTINWVHQWPNDALNFVSKRFLERGVFEPEDPELEKCVELCEYFHNSTIELSKSVRKKYSLYNYVTPASYLELNSLFKSLLIENRKKVMETKKMYEVSLEKLKGAEGQVTVMQEEMAAVQPSLSEISGEVDKYMTLVEKEQSEVSELEKIVKTEDANAADKKKIVDQLAADLDAEFGEVNSVLETALDSVASLSQSELAVARGVKMPSMALRLNLEAICIIKVGLSHGGTRVSMLWGYWAGFGC